MNICFITSWFPTTEQPHIAPFIYDVASSLGKAGVNISVITTRSPSDPDVSQRDSMTIYRVNKHFSLFSIMRLIKQINPEIIHVQAPNSFSSVTIIVSALLRIPIIATVHRVEIDVIDNQILFIIRRFVLRRFRKLIAVSNFSKSLAVKAGAEESKITVIHNSCDETRFFPQDKFVARDKLHLPRDRAIILFVGNLIKIKGIYTLINSLKILRHNFPDFLALIIGSGIEEGNLRAKIKEFGLNENVQLHGWRRDDLSLFYNAADVFVLPSTIEGNSVALLEAMASGVPLVASDIEANRECIDDGVDGFFFESGNGNNLAQKLMCMLNDKDLMKRISTRIPKIYSEKFSVEKQTQKYMNVYDSIVRTSSRSRLLM